MTNTRLWIIGLAVFVGLLANQGWAQSSRDTTAFWGADDFFILPWELPQWSSEPFSHPDHGLASLAQCGFNTAAFVRPQHLPLVEKLGLKCILAAQDFPIPWRTLPDNKIFEAVKRLVDEAGGSQAVMGYFLADEPGAPDFPALAKAVTAVKRLAPGKLAYINLFPDYATLGAPDISQLGTTTYTEYLERFVSEVKPQFISYDNYRIQFSFDQKDAAIAASYYNNLLEVRRVALSNGLPFWNIASSSQILPNISPPSPANLLLQAHTTMTAGAQGLTWYTYFGSTYPNAPIEKTGARTTSWSYLKMVNEQVKVLGPVLRRLKSTGVYFTPPVPSPTLPTLPGQFVESITCTTPLMVGEFTGPDKQYAMIVNLSLQSSAPFKLTLHDSHATLRQVSAVDGSRTTLDSSNSVWLTSGQGVLLELR